MKTKVFVMAIAILLMTNCSTTKMLEHSIVENYYSGNPGAERLIYVDSIRIVIEKTRNFMEKIKIFSMDIRNPILVQEYQFDSMLNSFNYKHRVELENYTTIKIVIANPEREYIYQETKGGSEIPIIEITYELYPEFFVGITIKDKNKKNVYGLIDERTNLIVFFKQNNKNYFNLTNDGKMIIGKNYQRKKAERVVAGAFEELMYLKRVLPIIN